jgi:serine/threonine protein kinase
VDSSLVAIKQVAKHTIRDAELNSIQSEITLLKKLKHPNIVKYIDFISSDLH